MLPKIKTELFDNIFYSVSNVNNDNVHISYMDYQITTTTSSTTTIMTGNVPYPTIGLSLFTKNIKLKKMDLMLTPFFDQLDINTVKHIYSQIKNELDKDFFKKVAELGEKSRLMTSIGRLDIDIAKLKIEYNGDVEKISRNIISKCISSGSSIAVNGRIGPAHWIVSNQKTYNYILNYLKTDLVNYSNNQITIGGISYNVNNSVDDDILLLGRKNEPNISGVHCFILTDENGDIYIQENINTSSFQKTISIYYSIDDIGTYPEYQYLKLNTRSLSYYRAKKLQRIKNLYGE